MCQVLAKHPDTNPDPDPKPNQVLAKHPPVFKACLRDVADRLDDHEAYVRLFAAQLLEPISANELRPHTADFKKRLYDYDVNVRKIAQAILARLGAL